MTAKGIGGRGQKVSAHLWIVILFTVAYRAGLQPETPEPTDESLPKDYSKTGSRASRPPKGSGQKPHRTRSRLSMFKVHIGGHPSWVSGGISLQGFRGVR